MTETPRTKNHNFHTTWIGGSAHVISIAVKVQNAVVLLVKYYDK